MKKFLLLGVMALLVASAGASNVPQKRTLSSSMNKSQLHRAPMPSAQYLENKMRMPGDKITAPKKAGYIENWYIRPAGAFYVDYLSVDGDYGYAYSHPFLFMKPFVEYHWQGFAEGDDENTFFTWDVFKYMGQNQEAVIYVDGKEVDVDYIIEGEETPIFYAVDGDPDDDNSKWYIYQMKDHEMGGDAANPKVESEGPVYVFSQPILGGIFDQDGAEIDGWASSKTMVGGGRWGDQYYTMTAYSGAEPYGDNDRGWWFGKNASHIDGMGQAFEKPTDPYLLRKVGFYLATSITKITNPVKLTCKVYKLNQIPAYNDTANVRLPEEPGELIVTGEGMLTQSVIDDNYGFMEFTLFGQDEDDPELQYEFSPTIDYPILVTIEGYNDLDDLVDFTTYVSSDEYTDEGWGELAYLKTGINEMVISEEGDTSYVFTGAYNWRGLNNFFQSGTMMTGFAIYIATDNPYIDPYFKDYDFETCEYTFPDEGGEMHRIVEINGNTYDLEGVDLFSWSASDELLLTWNGSDELPEWLNIEITEEEQDEDELGWYIHATVTADPLPEGLTGRKATIRFEIPGDYLDYTFIQGDPEPEPVLPEDVNNDGEVTVADINAVIDVILGVMQNEEIKARADVNRDGEVTVADINKVIEYILTH